MNKYWLAFAMPPTLWEQKWEATRSPCPHGRMVRPCKQPWNRWSHRWYLPGLRGIQSSEGVAQGLTSITFTTSLHPAATHFFTHQKSSMPFWITLQRQRWTTKASDLRYGRPNQETDHLQVWAMHLPRGEASPRWERNGLNPGDLPEWTEWDSLLLELGQKDQLSTFLGFCEPVGQHIQWLKIKL